MVKCTHLVLKKIPKQNDEFVYGSCSDMYTIVGNRQKDHGCSKNAEGLR